MPSAIELASAEASLETPISIAPAAPPEPKLQTPPPPPDKPPERPVSAPRADAAKPPEKPAEVKETAMQRATAKIKGVLDKPKAPEKPKADAPDDEIEKLIKPNQNAWRVYEAKKKAWAEKEAGFTTKVSEYEKKLAELEKRPQTAANDEKIQFLEKQLEEIGGQAKTYQQRLAERDYTQSPEYAEKFKKPWDEAHDEAYKFVSKLQVMDPETGEVARQATPADFEKVKNAEPQQRRILAKQLFGEDLAGDVVEYAKEIDRIRKGSDKAIEDHSKNFEKTAQERTMAQQKENEGYTRLKDENRAELEKEFPDMFSVEHYKDQPEMQKALQDGYSDYDQIRATYHQMSPEDRAANEVLARAHYAALPLMHKQVQALKTENESLKAEILKYRGSDPGAGKPGAGGKPAVEQVGNIASMSAKFDE